LVTPRTGTGSLNSGGPLFAEWRKELPSEKATLRSRLADGERGTWKNLTAFLGLLVLTIWCFIGGVSSLALLLAVFAFVLALSIFSPSAGAQDAFAGVYDTPGVLLQFAVRIRLKAGSLRYGEDLGVLSFSDGWLHFQGRQTEFHIAGDAALKDSTYIGSPSDLTIRLCDGALNGTVQVAPVTRSGATAIKWPPDLLDCWHEWRVTTASGRSLFPPRVPQNRTIEIAARTARYEKVKLIAGTALAALLLVLFNLELTAFSLAVLSLVVVVLLTRAARAGSRLRGLKRLRDETPSQHLLRRIDSDVRWAMFLPPSSWW
jgi:hypothetical protein